MRCQTCREDKADEDFAWRYKDIGVRQRRCRTCVGKKMREKRYELSTKYGLSIAQYETLLRAQDGVCKICKGPERSTYRGTIRRLAVDHDRACCPSHRKTCGECIRGLLCSSCNSLVGKFEKNRHLLREIEGYLDLGERP